MLKKFSMLIAILAFGFVLQNCTKDGPMGPAGKDGADGKDGNGTCATCHADNADDVNLIFAQYALSQHGKGIVYEEEAGRINCGGCHSGDGFIESVKLGQDDPVTVATSKINCRTCHTIHTEFDETDWALRVDKPVKLRHTGAEVDFKEGNTCARCHQARTFKEVQGADTVFITSGSSTYSRFGPHYGTPANVVSMKGLYHLDGPMTIPANNVHGNLSKGCVSCHMGKMASNPATGGHTFKMTAAQMTEIEECKTCHPTGDFAKGTKAAEIKTMLAEVRSILLEKKWLDDSQSHDYFAQSQDGNYMTKEQVQATLNYLFISNDHSYGAHNPTYVYAVMKNTLDFLQKQ